MVGLYIYMCQQGKEDTTIIFRVCVHVLLALPSVLDVWSIFEIVDLV